MSGQVMYFQHEPPRIIPIGLHYVNSQTGELVNSQGEVILPSPLIDGVAHSLFERVRLIRIMMGKARQTSRVARPALVKVFWNLLVLASKPRGVHYRLSTWKPEVIKDA